MADVDFALLRLAEKFITGANVHCVTTWIFCYKTSAPGSDWHSRYEQLLRDFVISRTATAAAREYANLVRNYSRDVRAESDRLNREISEYLPTRAAR